MSLQTGKLVSIQAGRVRDLTMPAGIFADPRDNAWRSGIFKESILGPVRITSSGIAGDEQADLENHGGPDNVVLAYDADHYPIWRERLGMPELSFGGFGENFTVSGFTDHDVCVGDIWEVGEEDLRLQVTQARQPCYKLARRLRQSEIVRMVMESSWGGWYLRVLRAGMAEAGMEIRQVERRHPEWTVARAVQTMYGRKRDRGPAMVLASLPELSARWREELV